MTGTFQRTAPCPFCAAGTPLKRITLVGHTLRVHWLGLIFWVVMAAWILGMILGVLLSDGPPPTLT